MTGPIGKPVVGSLATVRDGLFVYKIKIKITMKKLLSVLIVLAFIIPTITFADVYVNGYYRSNGTYVNGYYRSSPDSSPYNNYSYPGNTNPYTGKTATGNPDTYLNNYYNNSSGSSYSYPSTTYTAPSTPSCPSNSYYDGISSCKCNYGYSVSGSSCVSNDTICHNQVGYSSSYDSLSGNCKCDYNYVIGTSGQCVSASSYCSNQLGIMSQYNSLTKQCECMSGYEYNGSSCVYKKTNYSIYTPSVSAKSSAVQSTDDPKLNAALVEQINKLLQVIAQLQAQLAKQKGL